MDRDAIFRDRLVMLAASSGARRDASVQLLHSVAQVCVCAFVCVLCFVLCVVCSRVGWLVGWLIDYARQRLDGASTG